MRATLVLVAVALLASASSAASRVHISLRSTRTAIAGKPWTATLSVRPRGFSGLVRVFASGPAKRVASTAHGGRGAYRARLTFPKPGRWSLSARAGGSTSRLGAITVRKARQPLTFVWPTSVAVATDGTVVVVENGRSRVLRVNPATGAETVLASDVSRPIAVATEANGILLSTESDVVRIGGGTVASADAQVGPIAVAPNGDVYFVAGPRVFRNSTPIAGGFDGAHGIAVMPDGTVLVSDTHKNAVRRLDGSIFAAVAQPYGLAAGADGSLYVCDAETSRVLHLDPQGRPLGTVGPVFATPYALALDGAGGLYVVETAELGRVKHVAADGTVTTLSR